LFGHHHVEDDCVRIDVLDQRQRLLRIFSAHELVWRAVQVPLQQLPRVGVIVDHQHSEQLGDLKLYCGLKCRR